LFFAGFMLDSLCAIYAILAQEDRAGAFKGIVHPKLFQTFMNFFRLLNTKQHILKNMETLHLLWSIKCLVTHDIEN